MLALLVLGFVGMFAGGVVIGWLARGRVHPSLGNFHVRYHADTSQAIAAIRALDEAIERAPVDAVIRMRVEWGGDAMPSDYGKGHN